MKNGNRYEILSEPGETSVYAAGPFEAVRQTDPSAVCAVAIRSLGDGKLSMRYVDAFGDTQALEMIETLHGRPRVPGKPVTSAVRIPLDVYKGLREIGRRTGQSFPEVRVKAYRAYVEKMMK